MHGGIIEREWGRENCKENRMLETYIGKLSFLSVFSGKKNLKIR